METGDFVFFHSHQVIGSSQEVIPSEYGQQTENRLLEPYADRFGLVSPFIMRGHELLTALYHVDRETYEKLISKELRLIDKANKTVDRYEAQTIEGKKKQIRNNESHIPI